MITEPLWPTLTELLRPRAQARRRGAGRCGPRCRGGLGGSDRAAVGSAITEAVSSDLVRGVLATDALIGTFSRLDDPSLRQNVCFPLSPARRRHREWDVPIGGMGAVSGALAEAAARSHGAEILTAAEVVAISPDGGCATAAGRTSTGCTPGTYWPTSPRRSSPGLLGEPAPELAEGCQIKVNLMLRRLRRGCAMPMSPPDQAFLGGTFHINETWTQLDDAAHRRRCRPIARTAAV